MSPFRESGVGDPEGQDDRQMTSEQTIKWADRAINLLTSSFKVEGEENLAGARDEHNRHPEQPWLIVASHLSNLDAPAAVKALGEDFRLRIMAESMHFGMAAQKMLMKTAGQESFAPVRYRQGLKRRVGVFDPENFNEISDIMKGGETPWLAVHPFTDRGEMLEARIGSAYLANKTGAHILPVALELRGASVSMEGPWQLLKALAGKTDAVFHVGKPLQFRGVDVEIIEEVLRRRKEGEKITTPQRLAVRAIHEKLSEQAAVVAAHISAMLPEEQRGPYRLSK